MIKHPVQPVVIDEEGIQRFKQNTIVRYLLDNGGINLDQLARIPFDKDDRQHFAQLIGYSLCGYSELSYADTIMLDKIQIEARVDKQIQELKELI